MINLNYHTKHFLSWYFGLLKSLIGTKPVLTASIILITISSKVTAMLSALLPLKVILLAGSDSVPRYFSFFINEEHRLEWIIGLTVGSVISFTLTVILDLIVKKLSERGALSVVNFANDMVVLSQQDNASRDYYSRAIGAIASVLFILTFLLVLVLIYESVFYYFLLMLFVCYVLTAAILRFSKKVDLLSTSVVPFIVSKPKDYMRLFASIIFIGGFLVILYPYLIGDDKNIILSLIAFILVRKMSTETVTFTSHSCFLLRNKDRISALMFPQVQLQIKEKKHNDDAIKYFKKNTRDLLAREHLNNESAVSDWNDSTIPGVIKFSIKYKDPGTGKVCNAQQQVYLQKLEHLLVREEFLFKYYDRSVMGAPKILASFKDAGLPSQIVVSGTGEPLNEYEWQDRKKELRLAQWRITPSDELLQAYRKTKPLVQDRFSQSLIEKTAIAIDNTEERILYEEMSSSLPALKRALEILPVYVYNPELTKENIFWEDYDRRKPLVMTWGRWRLVPLGYTLPIDTNDNRIDELVYWINKNRPDIEYKYEAMHLKLATSVAEYLYLYKLGKFKSCIHISRDIVSLAHQIQS